MDYIELADTAVKIGLGAFVGGAFALVSSRYQHIHEIERERLKRRERVLEKTAEEFELAYQALSSKYERVLGLAAVAPDEKYWPNARECIRGSNDFPRLHIVESHLFLLGLKNEAKMVIQLRQIAGDFEDLALPENRSRPDWNILNLKLEEFFGQRVAIYDSLAAYYDNPLRKSV